jgi:hypothetical protein
MQALEEQIHQLGQQIDTLLPAMEQLSRSLVAVLEQDHHRNYSSAAATSPMLIEEQVGNGHGYSEHGYLGHSSGHGSGHGHSSHGHSYQHEPLFEHKDILLEGEHVDSHLPIAPKVISPEVQIQRLTAQLTAAYNRIAALEEQLLARRVL